MKSRHAVESDVPEACELLNSIIEIGGSTAYQEKLDYDEFKSKFLADPNCLFCLVCESEDGRVIGFQSLSKHTKLPQGWADIATFAQVSPKVRGVGTNLFKLTGREARQSGIKYINATIRADNASGLAYYSKLGFVDYKIDEAVPLKDGNPVDRISKKYAL